MEHKNVDCQEENQCDGYHSVKNQYTGEMIPNHTEESTGKGNQDQSQQKPELRAQFLSVSNGMDDAQQQEEDGCHLMDMDTGEGNHDGHNKTNEQCDVQDLFHAGMASVAEMVLMPKIK